MAQLILLKEELLESENTGKTQALNIGVGLLDSPHFVLHLCHVMDGNMPAALGSQLCFKKERNLDFANFI